MADDRKLLLGSLLYPVFELLDLFGPLEMFGNCPQLELCTVALSAGPVKSAQGVEAVADYALDDCPPLDLLLIPGGMGCREEISNQPLLDWIGKRVAETRVTMTVCSGSMLLADTKPRPSRHCRKCGSASSCPPSPATCAARCDISPHLY